MKVAISLTTIPSRIEQMEPCAASLADQGYPVYVWIPKKVHRTGNRFNGKIPDFLQGEPFHCKVVQDQGPITKLLPALDLGYDVIITCDDDVVYGCGWADELLNAAEKCPHGSVGFRGRLFQNTHDYNRSKLVINPPYIKKVHIITGTWGRLVRTADFHKPINWQACPLNDDIVIDSHLKHHNVPRFVTPHECSIRPYSLHKVNALWARNGRDNNRYLKELFW